MQRTYPTLRAFFEGSRWTQEELAEALGVTQPYISMLVKGERTPSLQRAIQIEQLTGVPIAALVATRSRKDGEAA